MGHHINENGEFQSDKHPELPPDKVIVSFKDTNAWPALRELARHYEDVDPEFAADIRQRLQDFDPGRPVPPHGSGPDDQ